MGVLAPVLAAAVEVWVAMIAAVASILVAVPSAIVARKAHGHAKELESLKVELQERADRARREQEAQAVLDRYREPLAAAAHDLQSRLYNILERDFLAVYGGLASERREQAIKSTVFRIAQYFGWTEILRQDIHSWKFAREEDTREVGELLERIRRYFLTDSFGPGFMIWSDEQRAIGELMIVPDGSAKTCLGYARFVELYPERFERWLGGIEEHLAAGSGALDLRLAFLQRDLRLLVTTLDPQELRYDHSAMNNSHVGLTSPQHPRSSR